LHDTWGSARPPEGRGVVLSCNDKEPRDQLGMTTIATRLAGGFARRRLSARTSGGWVAAGLLVMWAGMAGAPAQAADPAVVFMAQVGRELMAAARTHSEGAMSGVIERHADLTQIGLYSLGEYRTRLPHEERPSYFSGMARFIGRYAAAESPKYQVARVEWSDQTTRSASGVMVDSRIVLADGTSYDVRWAVSKYGNTYKVRDASVLGFSMTWLLKDFFEAYIAKNGGDPRALTAALNRQR
jgi:phospholipid transport system substrate-binding protein